MLIYQFSPISLDLLVKEIHVDASTWPAFAVKDAPELPLNQTTQINLR